MNVHKMHLFKKQARVRFGPQPVRLGASKCLQVCRPKADLVLGSVETRSAAAIGQTPAVPVLGGLHHTYVRA